MSDEPSPSLLAELSHELRTPLGAILGFADAMRDQTFGPLSETYREHAGLIHAAGRHMLDLVEMLTRAETGRDLVFGTFDITDLVLESLRLMRGQAEAKAVTLQMIAGSPVGVHADRRAIRQILLNLIANAVKFTLAGGEVKEEARAEDGDLILTVADSGTGMAGAGTSGPGLGLRIVRGLCRAHGGDLGIQSPSGGGTRVTARLPVVKAAA